MEKKTELEVRELETKPAQQFQSQMGKIAGFSGAALVFSGTILSAFKPPLIQPYALLFFYGFAIVAVLLSGFAIVVGRVRPYYRMTAMLGSASIYAVLASLISLSGFAIANFLEDWRQLPSITNISVEKALVSPNETAKLEADIKNPNVTDISYFWQADSGQFLDDEGDKVTWKAPPGGGIVKIELLIVPRGRIPPQSNANTNTDSLEAFDRKVIHIDVRGSTGSTALVDKVKEFVPRCTNALDKAYSSNLSTSSPRMRRPQSCAPRPVRPMMAHWISTKNT